jgi:hypothetical protein
VVVVVAGEKEMICFSNNLAAAHFRTYVNIKLSIRACVWHCGKGVLLRVIYSAGLKVVQTTVLAFSEKGGGGRLWRM